MKKFFVFLLAFLYIASSCEATVYLHYCMGKRVSIGFSPEKSTTCHRCGMKKSDKGMGCCKDEQKIIKTDKNQKLTDLKSPYSQQKKFISVIPEFRTYSPINSQRPSVNNQRSNSPPSLSDLPVYLMNCLFLI